MADIYGSHFEYAGISSRLYDLIFVNIETKRNYSSSGSIKEVSVFNQSTKRRHLIDDDYSDFPISFDIEIVTEDGKTLDQSERRKIEKWLFNKHDYRKLYLDISDDTYSETIEIIDGVQKRLYLNCRFVNPERLEYNGGIVGYRATLEADSGLWWQDPVKKTFESPSGGQIVVDVDTDLDDYTYPIVTIIMGNQGGDIIIQNNNDDSNRLTKFTDITAGSTIILKGEFNYINDEFYNRFANKNFPRLVDGKNQISVTGDVASISFEFNNRRML